MVEGLPLQSGYAHAGEGGNCSHTQNAHFRLTLFTEYQAILHSEKVVKKSTLRVWRVQLRHRVQQLSHEVSKYSSSTRSCDGTYGVGIFSTAAFSSSSPSEETAISSLSQVAGSQAGSSGGCPTHDVCCAALLTQVHEKTVGLLDKG